jgi:hypothetical protein
MRALLLFAGLSLGCGSRVVIDDLGTDGALDATATETSVDSTASDTFVATDTAVLDTAEPDDHTCTALADAICAGAKPCCDKHGFAYNETACRSAIGSWCDYQIAAVGSGLAVYDGSQLDACTASWKNNVATCGVDFLAYAKSYVPCVHLFNGVREPGSKCNPMGLDSLACKAPAGFGSYCDSSVSKCRAYGVVAIGSPCNFTGSTIRYCDVGSYCDLADPSPTCKKALPLGSACSSPDDLSCGMYNVCKDGKCAVGAKGGTACSSGSECASYTCTMGMCTSIEQVPVDESICAGK